MAFDPFARAEQLRSESPSFSQRLEGWDSLRQRYYKLRARHGERLWQSADGRMLESHIHLELRLSGPLHAGPGLFASPRMLALYWDLCDECELGVDNVLLLGERGVGKEVFAGVLAAQLGREVVTVNCAVLTESVAEALLFGVAGNAGIASVGPKGSPGFIERAEGKVLFLDELFDAPSSVQPKLLRLLQQREYSRVGDPDVKKLQGTTVVAASNRYPTHRALAEAMAGGHIRADMVDRFFARFEIPPLRERREELPLIADALLLSLSRELAHHASGRRQASFRQLHPETRGLLQQLPFDWPGNVRGLKAFLRDQVRLRRHESPGAQQLHIPREVLESSLPAPTSEAPSAPGAPRSELPPLSAWDKDGLRALLEQQLLDYLRAEARREGLALSRLDKDWVARTCARALKLDNISQKLRSTLGRNCGDIARLLSEAHAGGTREAA
jgi:transcriptional regulator with AAA-type ATPase domain